VSIHVGISLTQDELRQMLENLIRREWREMLVGIYPDDVKVYEKALQLMKLENKLTHEIKDSLHKDITMKFDKQGEEHKFYVIREPMVSAKKNVVVLNNITRNHYNVLRNLAHLAEKEEKEPKILWV